jgi:hypothetical protein
MSQETRRELARLFTRTIAFSSLVMGGILGRQRNAHPITSVLLAVFFCTLAAYFWNEADSI